jgi:HSP20 family protein
VSARLKLYVYVFYKSIVLKCFIVEEVNMETKNLVPWNWCWSPNIIAPNQTDEPLTELSNGRINQIFENFIKDFGGYENFLPLLFRNNLSHNLTIVPRVDVAASDKEYIIKADLPGIKEEDVNVSILNDKSLVIKARRDTEEVEKKSVIIALKGLMEHLKGGYLFQRIVLSSK